MPDDEIVLARLVDQGLASCDMVILSGGTSKGAGDLCYRAIARFDDPGIVVHGVALKPGKPLCLAVTGGKPIVDPARGFQPRRSSPFTNSSHR